jgi:hypothetical protein
MEPLSLINLLTSCLFRIGEQESKAIRHMQQLGLLAQKLNRTLVLPPMWKSRFSTCYRNPFIYYYDRDAFTRLGVVSETFEAFQLWISRRFSRPSSRTYDILPWSAEKKPSPQFEYATVSESADHISKGKRHHCLGHKTPRITFVSTAITIQAIIPKWHLDPSDTTGLANDIITVLQQETSSIIAMTWELRHPLFHVPEDLQVEYARQWTGLAQSISRRISPFIAVHWRMETVPAHHMQACASGLVSTVNSLFHLRRKNSFTDAANSPGDTITVYLATDYPLESSTSTAHSGTFKDLHERHHSAIRSFVDAFAQSGTLAPLRLTSLAREVRGYEDRLGIRLEDMDSGLMGILDKLIAMRSDWFVAGTRFCSRQR